MILRNPRSLPLALGGTMQCPSHCKGKVFALPIETQSNHSLYLNVPFSLKFGSNIPTVFFRKILPTPPHGHNLN